MTINEWKRLERCLSQPRGREKEPEQRLFFHVSLQLLGSSSLMSLVITYHSLAIDCDSPCDLQRSSGVKVGREICEKEGGGPSPADTGLQVTLVASSSMVYIWQERIWSLIRVQGHIRGHWDLTFWPFDLMPSALWPPLWPNKITAVSFWECCLSLPSFGLVCMNGCVFLSGA